MGQGGLQARVVREPGGWVGETVEDLEVVREVEVKEVVVGVAVVGC